MTTISKYFTSIKKAESYQNRLYSKYYYVRLINSPLFTESGNYYWEVML